MTEFARNKCFWYATKALKPYGLKLDFDRDDLYSVQRRSDNSIVAEFWTLQELEAFVTGVSFGTDTNVGTPMVP